MDEYGRESPEERKERRKQEQKKLRRELYQKAKNEFKNSEYAKKLKEKQKELRRAAYQQAKKQRDEKRRRGEDLELEPEEFVPVKPQLVPTPSREEKDRELWDQVQKASVLPRANLRLVKDGGEVKK